MIRTVPLLERKGIIHPHLTPLPSRERKIKELLFHRERKIEVTGLLGVVFR
jgi:hypothetical protein